MIAKLAGTAGLVSISAGVAVIAGAGAGLIAAGISLVIFAVDSRN